MFIIVIMPIHFENESRKDLTRLFLDRLKRQTMKVHPLLVGSTREEKAFAQEMDCFYIHQENIPLCKKFQKGVYEARKFNPDVIMVLDSDTWISDNYCEVALRNLQERQIDGTGMSHFYVLDLDRWVVIQQIYQESKVYEPTGTGRMFLARSLNKLDWRLFPDRTPSDKLEITSLAQCKKAGLQIDVMRKPLLAYILELRSSKWTSIQDWKIIRQALSISPFGQQEIENAKTWIQTYFPGGIEALACIQ